MKFYLYWNIDRAILEKQEEEGWVTKVIDHMLKDLKTAFPEMSGFSPRKILSICVNFLNIGQIMKLCNDHCTNGMTVTKAKILDEIHTIL